MTDWKPFNLVESFPSDYVVKILAAPGDVDAISVKRRECGFWQLNGFLKYAWSGQ